MVHFGDVTGTLDGDLSDHARASPHESAVPGHPTMKREPPDWRATAQRLTPKEKCARGVHEASLINGTHRCRWCGELLKPIVLPVREPS